MNLDLLYVNEEFLTKRAEEIRNGISNMCESLPASDVKPHESADRAKLSIDDKILIIEVFLEAQHDLCFARPQSSDEIIRPQSCRFVKETMLANKVVLPLSDNCPVRGLSSFAIWISDPDPSFYVNEPYLWRGTFLYLTEVHWDRAGFSTAYSGVSALQALINQMTGQDFFAYVKEEFEPYGRGRDLHPVDKLRELGGVTSGQRKITSLYKKRYFTDEQSYQFAGTQTRVNDLLGYPIYIAAAD